jgi:hypothetical protein
MSAAPIAIFAYNRPVHFQRAVEALCRSSTAASSDLHVFSDGPKTREAAAAVAQVRAFTRTIDKFASVTLHERERNLGLANSIIDGVTRVCEERGRVIVVEDDLLVAPHFLDYLNLALDRYADEPGVLQISGHMFPVDVPVDEDAFFLPFVTSWGWATWARAWRLLDPEAKGYELLKTQPGMRDVFNMNGAYDYFGMLEKQQRGEIDSWAIRWNLSVFLQRGLVLYPRKSLVQNQGFDGSGVHTKGDPLDQDIDPAFDPRLLPRVGLHGPAQAQVFAYFRRRKGLRVRVRNAVARLLS